MTVENLHFTQKRTNMQVSCRILYNIIDLVIVNGTKK